MAFEAGDDEEERRGSRNPVPPGSTVHFIIVCALWLMIIAGIEFPVGWLL